MTIRIWNAFSCNNSGSFRLVARFADTAAAREAAAAFTELRDQLAETVSDAPKARVTILEAIARHHELTFDDEGWYGSESGPHVTVDDNVLIAHHDYCLGLGPGIPEFLARRGAKVEQERWADLEISVLFRTTPGVDPRLDRDLHDLMAQLEDGRRIEDYKRAPIVTPWAEAAGRGSVAMFRDAGTFGMSIAIPPRQLADVRSWLAGHGITKYVLRIDEPADGELFVLLHRARCTACSGPLEYLDPRLHDIESPQLVCRPCGGLYELSAFSAGP